MIGEEASIPSELRHARFVATPLTAATAALDHASYTSSPDVIRVHSDGRWPVEGFTLDDNLALVAQHQADHEARRAFTFTLLDPSRRRALGCLYLNPLHDYLERVGAAPSVLQDVPWPAAMVTFWLSQDLQGSDLADEVVSAVHTWVTTEWPLATHAFRVLPAETSSCAALERLDLRRTTFDAPGETRPYRWYAPW